MLWTMCFLPEDSVLSGMGGRALMINALALSRVWYLASGH